MHEVFTGNERLIGMFSLALNNSIRHQDVDHSRPHPASASVQHIHRQKIRKERNEDEWHDRIEYLGWRIPADRTECVQRQYRCNEHTDDRFHDLNSHSDS